MKLPPEDCFRGIGFETEMYFDGCRETIFFHTNGTLDNPRGKRFDKVSQEAVLEFISYWTNQIAVATDYLRNGCNPKTHEWEK